MRLRGLSIVLTVAVLAGTVAVGTAAASGVSAAQAQYTNVPPVTKHKPSSGVKGATASKSNTKPSKPAPVATSGLPFTGMSLLLPLLLSLALIAVGIGLRRTFRSRSSQP